MRGGGGGLAVCVYTHEVLGHRRLMQATHIHTHIEPLTHTASAECQSQEREPCF